MYCIIKTFWLWQLSLSLSVWEPKINTHDTYIGPWEVYYMYMLYMLYVYYHGTRDQFVFHKVLLESRQMFTWSQPSGVRSIPKLVMLTWSFHTSFVMIVEDVWLLLMEGFLYSMCSSFVLCDSQFHHQVSSHTSQDFQLHAPTGVCQHAIAKVHSLWYPTSNVIDWSDVCSKLPASSLIDM